MILIHTKNARKRGSPGLSTSKVLTQKRVAMCLITIGWANQMSISSTGNSSVVCMSPTHLPLDMAISHAACRP